MFQFREAILTYKLQTMLLTTYCLLFNAEIKTEKSKKSDSNQIVKIKQVVDSSVSSIPPDKVGTKGKMFYYLENYYLELA